DPVGTGPPGGATTGPGSGRQARSAATTNAGCKALCTDDAFSRGHAGHAIACKQARNAVAAGTRCKIGDAISAAGTGQAGHRIALAASGRRCQAGHAVTPNTRCTAGATACEANCASSCRRGPANGGAQGCPTATKRVSGRQDHGGRERSARLQVDQLARNSSFL